ncbi:uncharacterized protein A4U43_C01F27190 [Asparagus officinalis]|uniref:Uncharacterized protein n=1 Tax=Asparagus officinalis TaxID=4686 RepID=A0A5P1FV14_ASPOF|nr:uncharacterized protein A4U43_C01F27190 [Asparagus officinalis]
MTSFPEFKEPYDPKNIKSTLGLFFKSRQFLKKVLIDYFVHNFHSFKFDKIDKQRVKMIRTGKDYEWKIYASPYNNTDAFQVKTYHQYHPCSMVHDNKRASDSWLASQWVKTLKMEPQSFKTKSV